MKMNIKGLIQTANKKQEADIVFKNAKIINVFTNEIIEGNLAIKDGIIIGIGDYSGKEEVNLEGKYVSPGFIDGHVHIESSMVSPLEFSKNIVVRGTTTIVADPHEIANVKGVDGINYILESTENLDIDTYIMLPSCVPATEFETSGAILKAEDLREFIDNPRVLGLGELMNYIGVINAEENIIDKLNISQEKIIDGHGPMIDKESLNAYKIAGVKTEHECSTIEEMLYRIRVGMYVQIREGTAARNLGTLIEGVNKDNIRRCIFCTDDKHPEDLIETGHIDNNVRLAVKKGIDAVDAIKMASLNTAECYGLKNRGALAPGYIADIVVFEDLNDISIELVYKKGKLVAKKGTYLNTEIDENKTKWEPEIKIKEFNKKDLEIKLSSNKANIIEMNPYTLVTNKIVQEVILKNEKFEFKENSDILKVIVVERHTGNSGKYTGLLKGYGIKNGAIGTTIAHDSHNLIVVGDNDEDILNCINYIREIGGGIAVSSKGEILEHLRLEIGGIMSNSSINTVSEKLDKMMKIARDLGVSEGVDPFMSLSFLALPVIPDIKITDKGLFDVSKFQFIDINS